MIVALSGGRDSVALLHLLSDLACELDLHLEAAHFDHRVRRESARDAAFAVETAAGLGLACHVGAPDVPPSLRQASLREARYAWLLELVRDRNADRLAVGHHADDQAETVLFRLMRGTDLHGLAGIPPRRGSIVRPLLTLRRSDLTEYLKERGAGWLDDPSNDGDRWMRGRLRHVVLPALEAVESGMTDRLLSVGTAAARTMAISERAAACLLRQARWSPSVPGRLDYSREKLVHAGTELLAVAIRQVARGLGGRPTAGGTRTGVEFISGGRSGGRVAIGNGLWIEREYDRIGIGRVAPRQPSGTLRVEPRSGRGRLSLGGRPFDVRWRPLEGEARLSGRIAVAVAPGHYPLVFRGWVAGDRIRLAGGTRKLKKVFGERRIPLSERHRVPVLADRLGNVLWVEGLGAAEPVPDAKSQSSWLEFELRHE